MAVVRERHGAGCWWFCCFGPGARADPPTRSLLPGPSEGVVGSHRGPRPVARGAAVGQQLGWR
eukprot:3967390-Lingulodinium_polyedra.AAC.1